MSKSLVLESKLFPTEPEGDLELCNGQPGSALAGYLREEMSQAGYKCEAIIQEDYGWGFWIGKNDLTVWVAVSYAAASESEPGSGEWYVTAAYEVPFLIFRPKFWFKGGEGGSLESEIYSRLKSVLSTNSQIRIIREE